MSAAIQFKDFVMKRENSMSPPGWEHSSESEQPLDFSRSCMDRADQVAVQRVPSQPCSSIKQRQNTNSDLEQSWMPRHEIVAPFPLRVDPRFPADLLLTGLPLSKSTAQQDGNPQYYQQALLQQISKNTQRINCHSSAYPTSGILSSSNKQSTDVRESSEQSDHSNHSSSNSSPGLNDSTDIPALISGNVHQLCDSSTTLTSQAIRATRKRGKAFPEELKDSAYWERRRRNNAAAKRSRDARRAKEDETAVRAALLEQENFQLRIETNTLRQEIERIKSLLVQPPLVRT